METKDCLQDLVFGINATSTLLFVVAMALETIGIVKSGSTANGFGAKRSTVVTVNTLLQTKTVTQENT